MILPPEVNGMKVPKSEGRNTNVIYEPKKPKKHKKMHRIEKWPIMGENEQNLQEMGLFRASGAIGTESAGPCVLPHTPGSQTRGGASLYSA